jgi:hypothetical protein
MIRGFRSNGFDPDRQIGARVLRRQGHIRPKAKFLSEVVAL